MSKVVRFIFLKKSLMSKIFNVWDELLLPEMMFNALEKLDIFS